MEISEIKQEMKRFRDFYGGDILDIDAIDSCETKKELAYLLYRHELHMEMMLCDAISHLEQFRKRVSLGLASLD